MAQDTDHPNVIAPPPLLFLGALMTGFILDLLIPTQTRLSSTTSGAVLIGAGLALGSWAFSEFKRAGTEVNPLKPSTALVTSGPFKYTRNPFYVALLAVYFGFGLLYGSLFILVLVFPLFFLLERGVIVPEETYLEKKFGDKYRAYQAAVGRWCWLLSEDRQRQRKP